MYILHYFVPLVDTVFSLLGCNSEKSMVFDTKSQQFIMSTSNEEINADRHEARLRAPSRKGYQNILLNRTSTFNKVTKNFQRDIEPVNISIENPELLKEASDMLKQNFIKILSMRLVMTKGNYSSQLKHFSSKRQTCHF